MRASDEYADFVRERLSRLDSLTVRPMMGGYVIHYAGRVLGFIFGETLLFEDGPAMRRLLPSAQRTPLFPGAKDFVVIDDEIPAVRLCGIAAQAYADLPLPRPRKRKAGKGKAGMEKDKAAFAQFKDAPEFD